MPLPDAHAVKPETQTPPPGILPVAHPRVKDRASLRLALAFQAVSVVLDIASVFAAFWIAHFLRYRVELFRPVLEGQFESYGTFSVHALAAVVLMLFIFPSRGVYQIRHRLSLIDYLPRIVGGYGMVIAGVVLMAFFLQFSPSRLIYVYALVFGLVLMIGHRFVTTLARKSLLERGIGVDRVLLVGDGENARRLMHAFHGHPELGYRLVGFVSEGDEGDTVNVGTETGVVTARRLGTLSEVGNIVRDRGIDEVIIVEERRPMSEIVDVVDQCRERVVQFRVVPNLLQISLDRVDISDINGVPTIGIRDGSIGGWNAILKRTIDVTVSGLGLAVLAIPMAIVAVLIKRDSEGNVLYTQTRLGKNGRPFTMYKFRCMVSDADQRWSELVRSTDGADRRLFKDPNDPRLTRTGKWLRKMSLDELPQLWNVLKGDMSLIGPRPPLPKEVAEYEEWQKQRLLVRPGLTGLWQVNGRSDLSFDEMIHLDLYYAENWSAWLDLKILLRTIPAVLLRRGAY